MHVRRATQAQRPYVAAEESPMRELVLIAVAFPIAVLVLAALLVTLAIEIISMYGARD